MGSTGKALQDTLAQLGMAEPADYVCRRRDLVEEFIASVSSPESREKLQELQHSLDQLRAISGGSSRSLPEMLDMLRDSLQQIAVLSERLKRGCEQLPDSVA
ncbi:MAG: DUF3135 domain-containing protein [Rhodocyclales bacterium]|nr:DUF3135 domain-containing protein [Rhodocyclales bacterium]